MTLLKAAQHLIGLGTVEFEKSSINISGETLQQCLCHFIIQLQWTTDIVDSKWVCPHTIWCRGLRIEILPTSPLGIHWCNCCPAFTRPVWNVLTSRESGRNQQNSPSILFGSPSSKHSDQVWEHQVELEILMHTLAHQVEGFPEWDQQIPWWPAGSSLGEVLTQSKGTLTETPVLTLSRNG